MPQKQARSKCELFIYQQFSLCIESHLISRKLFTLHNHSTRPLRGTSREEVRCHAKTSNALAEEG